MLKTIGALDALGALGLIVPAALDIAPTPVAALGLCLLMIGAAITHARRGEVANVVVKPGAVRGRRGGVWGRLGPHAFA